MLKVKIIKWLGFEKLDKPEITVELIPSVHETPKIDYTHINHMDCNKVGTHIKTFNNLIPHTTNENN